MVQELPPRAVAALAEEKQCRGAAKMAVVTRAASRVRKCRCQTKSFQRTLAQLKAAAHRLDRRRAREALRRGEEVIVERPLLTDWDIV